MFLCPSPISGSGASLVERTPRRLVVEFDQGAETALLEEALAVERECCPFFVLDWEASRGRLTASIAHAEHEPALNAIAYALGLGAGTQRAASGGLWP